MSAFCIFKTHTHTNYNEIEAHVMCRFKKVIFQFTKKAEHKK
jgi:hypothetical protein